MARNVGAYGIRPNKYEIEGVKDPSKALGDLTSDVVPNSSRVVNKLDDAGKAQVRALVEEGHPVRAAVKFVKGERLTPHDFGIKSITSDPAAHRLWEDTVSSIANSERSNVYRELLKDIDNGTLPTDRVELNQRYSEAFSYVSQKYRNAAKAQNVYVGDAIHHWNYNKANYGAHVFHPDNLFPVNEQQHLSVHKLTTSGQTYRSPISSTHALDLPLFTPLAPR